MKKIHWFLFIQVFYFGLAYSAWNDNLTIISDYEKDENGTWLSVEYTFISNAKEFDLFVEAAKKSWADGSKLNANIKLSNDIDLGYYFDGKVCRSKTDSSINSFNPIVPFEGFFNGSNYTIRGLCVQEEDANSMVGLFSESTKTIKNLKIENAYVQGDVAGVIIGGGVEETKMINVHVSNSTVIGASAVGGLAGKQVISIENSSVIETKLVLQSENESGDIGGLMGRLDVNSAYNIKIEKSFVKNTSFNSTLSKQNLGGLIGSIQSEYEFNPIVSILNSFVETDISTQYQINIGGLIGLFSVPFASVSINSSHFKGNIISSQTNDNVSCIGGLVGSATNVITNQSFQKGFIKTEAGLSVGGFIGQITGNETTQIAYSYQIGIIHAKSTYKGLFIGSNIDGGYSIESAYSVPDSSSNIEVVGINNPTATNSFSGFIANENGESSLKGNTKVKPSLLQHASAAYLLNHQITAPLPLHWTQIADSNNGYPFIKPESFYSLYQVILIDSTNETKVNRDTVYNSPLTGKIEKTAFEKHPKLGGTGQDKYSFEEIINNNYTGNSLTSQKIIDRDATFYLSQTNRYAIKYNLKTSDFIYWLTDSITDYSEKYNSLTLPKIIKKNSCFLGWIVFKNGIENQTDAPQNTIYFDDFFGESPFSAITITAQWGDLTDCDGLKSEVDYSIPIQTTHGLVSLSNNGKRLTPGAWGYNIPVVSNANGNQIPVPIRIEATPKKDYELDSLYYADYQNNINKPFFSGSLLSTSSSIEIFAVFKSTTGIPNPLYTITYDIPFEPVNDTSPTLFLTEQYSLEYNNKQPAYDLPQIVKVDHCFEGWEIHCTETGTCSQSGFLTDSPIREEGTAHNTYSIPESFEGHLTLKPISKPCEEDQTIVQVEVKSQEHGYLTLWNNQRELLSGAGVIKYPIMNDAVPPLTLKPVADSSYEIRSVSFQYADSENIENDFLNPYFLPEYVSISPLFNKMTLAFGPHAFTQKGGAFSYQGSLDNIDAESEVSVTLLIQNKEATFKDSLILAPLKSNDTFSLEKVNLPLGDLNFTVSLKAANTVISKEYDFFVDTSLQFKPSSWQMISLSNASPAYKKLRDEIIFGWNDTTALGDFWQYQELRFTDQIHPSQGYWYQSLNKTSIPLEIKDSSSITPETIVSWDLVSGQTGWNLIANPFHWPISLYTPQDNDSIAFWKWNDSLGAYDRTYHLDANSAAWVQVSENKIWKTTAAPFLKSTEAAAPKRQLAKTGVSPENWRIQLKLKNALGKEDAYNFIGVAATASFLKEPPQGMGSFVNLSILKNKDKLAEHILSSKNSIWSWDILLSSSENNKATLKMEGIQALLEMGYKVALNKDGEIIEVKENTPIHLNTKQEGSKATITVMPAEQFFLAQKIDRISYYKQGSAWKIKFEAGIALDRSKAVVSLHNIKGIKLNKTTANVNLGLNEFLIEGADYAGIVIANITIYNENEQILYQHQQKLLEKH